MQIKAAKREKKRRTKMAMHGKGIKRQPARGISKYARRGRSV